MASLIGLRLRAGLIGAGDAAATTGGIPCVPPLRVWALAGLLAAACVGASLVGFAVQDDAFVVHNRDRLEAFATVPQRPHERRVVALGDSRLRYAVGEADDADTPAAAEPPAPVLTISQNVGVPDDVDTPAAAAPPLRLLTISQNFGVLDDFLPLLDDIVAARADVLLVQHDLLTRHRPLTRRYANYLLGVKTRLTGDWADQEQFQSDLTCARDERGDAVLRDAEWWSRYATFQREEIRHDGVPTARQRLASLQDWAARHGVALRLYELRSTPWAEERFAEIGSLRASGELASWLEAERPVPFWRFPQRLRDERLYCDFMHAGPVLRGAYLGELSGRLRAEPS